MKESISIKEMLTLLGLAAQSRIPATEAGELQLQLQVVWATQGDSLKITGKKT